MTKSQMIDGEEYLCLRDAAEILKSQNIKLSYVLSTFKRRIKKRSFIKKVDVENLVTFHKESELLRQELAQKKVLMMAQYEKEMDELKEKCGIPADALMIEGKEYIGIRLATKILDINLQELSKLSCWNLIKRYSKKSRPWILKSDVEKIKVEAGSGFEKICKKYDDKIKAYEAQEEEKRKELIKNFGKAWKTNLIH